MMPNEQNNAEINYEQPYITKDEYLRFKGVNLDIELQDTDNKSDKVDRFVKDLTHFVMDWLVKNYACNELNRELHDFSELAEFRRKRFHYGMLDQIEYCLNNGMLHQDSGVVSSTGAILDYSHILIGGSAFNQFKLGAFCNIEREW